MRPLARSIGAVFAQSAVAAIAAITAISAAASLVGCGGGTAYDGRVYHAQSGLSFHVGPVPAGWRKLDKLEGPLLAFDDRAHGGAVSVYGRCGKDGDDVPLGALTNHLLIGFTEREVKSQKVLAFDGREAMHTVASAKLDGVAVGLGIYVLKKDGCVYDVVYVAPPASFDEGVADFDAFAMGFGTGEARP